MNDYVLRGGDQGAARLALLARVGAPSTLDFFKRLDVRSPMRCLDVGCGAGAVTLELARLVQPGGAAIGLDRDERCLEIARAQTAEAGLPTRFEQVDVADLVEQAAFDLVYARFLLTHFSDPQGGLARLVHAARPGGRVAVEDIDFRMHLSRPDCPAFRRYQELYREVVRQKGGDADIGPRLPRLFLEAGLEEVHADAVLPLFSEGEGKLIAAVTMEHIREAVIAAGLATTGEIDAIVGELSEFARAPGTVLSMPQIYQVSGVRPQ
ncbi:MAG: methyltransferase domain-containing protein [Gemmataceae bacterium]